MALDDAQLKDLIVGKSPYLQNNVTGGKFRVTWDANGLYLIRNVDGQIPQPSNTGDLLRGAYQGASSSYQIKDGKIVTTLGDSPFETTVYKLGDKYYGARSNEFGYVNYEIIPPQQQFGTQVEYEFR